MPSETLTLALDGTVSLERFADAVKSFRDLVGAISKNVAKHDAVTWEIESLATSSAIVTVRGRSPRNVVPVHRVALEFEHVAERLRTGESASPRKPIQRAANDLLKLLDQEIEGLRFETADHDFPISAESRRMAGALPTAPPVLISLGAVDGKIQTVSNRGSVRFTLYDTLHDRAVSCYIRADQEDMLRGLWGHRAIVEGEVSRDGSTGRVMSVRQISDITPLPDDDPDGWRAAIGAVPRTPESPLPEDAIRRLRDEW